MIYTIIKSTSPCDCLCAAQGGNNASCCDGIRLNIVSWLTETAVVGCINLQDLSNTKCNTWNLRRIGVPVLPALNSWTIVETPRQLWAVRILLTLSVSPQTSSLLIK